MPKVQARLKTGILAQNGLKSDLRASDFYEFPDLHIVHSSHSEVPSAATET